jgi:hypothetical protein
MEDYYNMDEDSYGMDEEGYNLKEDNWEVVTEHLFCVLKSLKAEGYTNLDILKGVSFIACDLSQSITENDK